MRRTRSGAADVGATIRVQESARNASGTGAPAASSATAAAVSNVPRITSITPATGVTGSSVTIAGSALNGATLVRFGGLSAAFTVLSPTRIEAAVPPGAITSAVSVTTPVKSATSMAKFVPTLSVTGFLPHSGAPGTTVTIWGVGFNASSSVSFDGVTASTVSHLSSTRLTAVVPAGTAAGTITVANGAAPAGSAESALSYFPS